MNCIDAIEGVIKCIVNRTIEDLISDQLDDTEYIRNIKTVIIAAGTFLKENKEISDNPDVIKRVLYDYAKEKWTNHCANLHEKNKTTVDEADSLFDREYLCYYYDYIYERSEYPL